MLRKELQKNKRANSAPQGHPFGRSVKTQARASVIENVPEGLPRALLAIVTHLYEVVVS